MLPIHSLAAGFQVLLAHQTNRKNRGYGDECQFISLFYPDLTIEGLAARVKVAFGNAYGV